MAEQSRAKQSKQARQDKAKQSEERSLEREVDGGGEDERRKERTRDR
jgi:hypothetical protein